MAENIVLAFITMNAGKDIPGSTLRWALKNWYCSGNHFDKIIICDGNLTKEAKEFYSQFDRLEYIDSPWREGFADCYVYQYRQIANRLNDGDWCLYLDDDEIPSLDLICFVDAVNEVRFYNQPYYTDIELIKLPCILHLTENGKNYFRCEPYPGWITTGIDGVYSQLPGQWTKNILFKKTNRLDFRWFGSHVLPTTKGGKEAYVPHPYYHMKSLESFIYNDVWQGFLSPEGQGYTPQEVAKFRMLTQCYKSTKEFKEATKKGTWSPPLKKFAWDNRMVYDRPISRLAWVYYILEGHPMPEPDEFMDWNNVKRYVLSEQSMKIYNDAKKNGLGIIVDENI